MEPRTVGYGGTFPMPPYILKLPIYLDELKYIGSAPQPLLYLESGTSPTIAHPQIYKDCTATVTNRHVTMEAHDNVILIPNITAGNNSVTLRASEDRKE